MKKFLITVCVLALLAGGGYYLWNQFFAGDQPALTEETADVYASKVSDLMNSGVNESLQNRYSGVVETLETLEIPYSQDKTIQDCFVKEGDAVEIGTPLLSYNTEEIQMNLENAQLEIDRFTDQIDSLNHQIESLTADKAKASADQQLDYSIQIKTAEASIKEAEYSRRAKEAELGRIQHSLENNVVTSTIKGRVQKINETPGNDANGNPLPYMVIITEGDVRIKGTINETNAWSISEGQPVLIRSRIDETQIWTGTIDKIDFENKVTSSNNNFYGPQSSDDTSSKYPFYIHLDSSDGLMLGQHVFIELDMGQTEVKTGLWLYQDYIVTEEDGSTFVWCANEKQRLEKRPVTLGEYDENQGQYQILEGLVPEDYIVYPDDTCTEGASVYCFDPNTRYSE